MSRPVRRLLSFLLVLQFIIPYPVFAAAIGEFTSVVGKVTQTRANKEITPVVKSPVEMKDFITTGRDGSATMAFSDESTIALAPNSKLQIKEFLFKDKSRKAAFSLGIGKMTAEVKKYIGGDNSFVVESPTAIAGVRGTGFEFVVAMVGTQLTTTVTCTAGALSVSALSATGAVISTTTIVAGQVAVVSAGGITVSAAGAAAAGAAGTAAGTATAAGIGVGTIAMGVVAAAVIVGVVAAATSGTTTTTHHH
ncbi:MAG: FecR family protein [Syntrophales bacterium]|nr:FecR family protein [Syntrophales bacterium]